MYTCYVATYYNGKTAKYPERRALSSLQKFQCCNQGRPARSNTLKSLRLLECKNIKGFMEHKRT